MTNLPDDLIDPVEARLVRRVRGYTERVVVPIDPVAIAAAASATRPSRFGAFARFGLVFAGAAAVAVVVGMGTLIIGGPPHGPGATGSSAAPTEAVMAPCNRADVTAQIIRWEGAAGNRIATVEVLSVADEPCALGESPQLRLLDSDLRSLISGRAANGPGSYALHPGERVQTLVDVSNYCGLEPAWPLSISFSFDSSGSALIADPAASGDSGVPPCNGPGQPAEIQMQPWSAP